MPTPGASGGPSLSISATELSSLVAFERDAWALVAKHVATQGAPSQPLVQALWKESQRPRRWIQELSSALREEPPRRSISESRVEASAWLKLSLGEAFPKDHQVHRTFAIASAGTLGLPLEEVQALAMRAKSEEWLPLEQAKLKLLVADAAIDEKKWLVALPHVLAAKVSLETLGDAQMLNRAERTLVGVLMHRGNWPVAFEVSDKALAKKLRFPPMSPYGTSYPDDPAEQAVQEISEVARWASVRTPEWVRALGALAATTKESTLRAELLLRFKTRLNEMLGGEYGAEDLQIVVRQLKERGFGDMAKMAQTIAKE